jgi:hemolysin activation/secretion protein
VKPSTKPCAFLIGACLSMPALSGQVPAAAELQGPAPVQPQQTDPAALPRPVPVAPPAVSKEGEAGARVTLKQIKLTGCQAMACETLLAHLGPVPGQPLSLSDIEALAQRVADDYKRSGYPFVQVIVPPQRVADGVLTLRIIEGVLGKATVEGPDPLVPGAQPFLEQGLPTGQPIRETALERTMLLMDDQPGFKVRPVLRPGAAMGEGDLLVGVTRQNHVIGEVGLDNIGSRSTGQYRARAALYANSPFIFGDRVSLNTLTTDERMWLGSIDYERPLGAAGWRGQAGWSRTSYQLGGAFAALGAKGYADTATLKTSFPVLRSQNANLLTSAAWLHKTLQDRFESVDLVKDKSSDVLVLAGQFDRRDAFLGGGVSYGQLSVSTGRLRMDDASGQVDAATAQSAGGFTKGNIDVARIQKLPGAFSAYGRFSAQWTAGNLDSSEKYGLGGFLGVRAYPMGEATGDRGWLTQWELRMAAGEFTTFAFADAGRMTLNAKPWDDSSASHRYLAGAGLGVRWGRQGWSVESTVAGRIHGGPSQSESIDAPVRWYMTLSRRFD